MGIIARRRKKFQALLAELESVLIEKGITPYHFFKDGNLHNYLACIPFNHLLDSMKLTRVNVNLTDEESRFVGFILKYKELRKKKYNILLDTPPDPQYYDSPPIGRRENPRYEEEMEQYRMKLDEYQHQADVLEKKREELRRTPEGEIFEYVENEDGSVVCPQCMGRGTLPAENGSLPAACPQCGGSGSTGYTPKVTEEQRQTAETFRVKLESLKDPVFADFPRKKKQVFIRLTYEGQIFIKEVKG